LRQAAEDERHGDDERRYRREQAIFPLKADRPKEDEDAAANRREERPATKVMRWSLWRCLTATLRKHHRLLSFIMPTSRLRRSGWRSLASGEAIAAPIR
jgi:hypothetical protein